MKRYVLPALNVFVFICFCFSASPALAADYEALKEVKTAKAVFDFRIGDPKSALMQMNLIHQTYKDLSTMKKAPAFAVVFIGPSVRLVSTDREGIASEDQKLAGEFASIISAMSKDGITFEICLVAAKAFKVDPASVLPEITKVGNGWISEIGYQARGYSLVPAY